VFSELEKTNEEPGRIVRPLLLHLSELDVDTFRKLSNEIEVLLKFAAEKEIQIDIMGIIDKDVQAGKVINPEVYVPFLKTRFEKLLLKRLLYNNTSDLVIEYFWEKILSNQFRSMVSVH